MRKWTYKGIIVHEFGHTSDVVDHFINFCKFTDAVECYSCEDKFENTTCAEPSEGDLKEMEIIKCRKGACVKWIHYRDCE